MPVFFAVIGTPLYDFAAGCVLAANVYLMIRGGKNLFNAFCGRFPEADIDLERFSPLVLQGCSLLNWQGVHRGGKKRLEKGKNPQATLLGIAFKGANDGGM